MKRIAFLDYVRVFACFLVMLVHASENFYGAAGSTDMAGPQSFLQNEADRLWVSVYDGFSRMSVPLFMIVSAYLLAPMKKGQSCWQFYRKRFLRIMPPFIFFMVLYSTLPMLWGQIDGEQSLNDLSRIWLNFPALAGHFWFMYPLISLYLFIPVTVAGEGLGQGRTFLHRTVPGFYLYTFPQPLVWRGVGTVLLERISHVMVFFGLFGLPCAGTLYPRASCLGAFLASEGRFPAHAGGRGGHHVVVLCPGCSGSGSFYAGH